MSWQQWEVGWDAEIETGAITGARVIKEVHQRDVRRTED